MELIGAKPHPRLLAWGVGGEPLADFITTVAPTTKFLESERDILNTRIKEWDGAVIIGDPPRLTSFDDCDLSIQFGGDERIASYRPDRLLGGVYVRALMLSVATEFILPENLPPAVRDMVLGSLIPFVQSHTPNRVLIPYTLEFNNIYTEESAIQPFLLDGAGLPLAGRVTYGQCERWWLPGGITDTAGWLNAALSVWSGKAPDRFPSEPVWVKRPEWQTQEERSTSAALIALADERAKLLEEMNRREAGCKDRLAALTRAANAAERRLLTAQGDALAEEVRAALIEIGFEVADADRELAVKGDLLEDLRVQDADSPDWIALAEVRGYTGGAKVSDFQRIARFVERYIRAEGKVPAARWYVVNHNLTQDPGTRPEALASNREEVGIFADSGGLVIDTRALFTMRDKVATGALDAAAARRELREAVGIFRI